MIKRFVSITDILPYEPDYEEEIKCPELKYVKLGYLDRVLIDTGIQATVGTGFEIQIRPRSGNALKKGLSILNTPGTIDESYRGNICVIMINLSKIVQTINIGDKIAQMVVAPVMLNPIIFVDKLDSTERNNKGFGSSENKK
jgi:dUTP pyrophosphatase